MGIGDWNQWAVTSGALAAGYVPLSVAIVRLNKYRWDEITGLMVRRAWNVRARAVIRRELRRPRAVPLVLFMLDINGMKAYNALVTHLGGDAVLGVVGGWLKRTGLPVGRTGGDEFAVLVRSANPRDLAARLARRVHGAVTLDGLTLPVSSIVTYARFGQDGQTLEALWQAASRHMIAAKAARGRYGQPR